MVTLGIHKQHKKELLLLALLLTSIFLTLQINLPNNKIVASGDAGTQVGGTLTSNTTWTTANSPYIITNTVQIPDNIILTIESGVTVTTQSSSNTMFLINGIIQAHGNAANRIIFDGNNNSDFFKTNHPIAKGFIDLDYCVIRNGKSAFWLDNTAFLNLTNSELSNLSQSSYLWYPSQDTFIEFNTFINTTGIKIGTDEYFSNSSGFVYIKYNLFINNQGSIINNFASYGLSKTFVNNNSFVNTTGIILEVEKTSTTADMDASQNYWGITDTTIIDSMIYDKNDDVLCTSIIDYLPILDVPDPDVPIAPTPTPSPTPTPFPTETPTPTSTPTTTPNPSSSPNPSTQPTVSPTPTTSPTTTTTPTSTAIPTNSPTQNPTSDPKNPTTRPTANPSDNPINVDPNSNPVSTPIVPEFPPLAVILMLLAVGSTGLIMLKSKNFKSTKTN